MISYIYTDKAVVEKDKHYNNQNFKIISNDSYNMIHEIKEFLTSRVYAYENNNIKKVLILEPTDITDVYYVYENQENNYQNHKISIMYICIHIIIIHKIKYQNCKIC